MITLLVVTNLTLALSSVSLLVTPVPSVVIAVIIPLLAVTLSLLMSRFLKPSFFLPLLLILPPLLVLMFSPSAAYSPF